MKINLMNNLFLKVLSLVAAIILWAVVLFVSDAESTKVFIKEVNLMNTQVLTEDGKMFRVEEGTDIVKLTVRARKSVLSKLSDSDFAVTADVEKNLMHKNLVAMEIECKNRDIVVDRDVTPSHTNVVLRIEDSKEEPFSITIEPEGIPNEGLIVGALTADPAVVKIKGPNSIVNRIKTVKVKVDITGILDTEMKNCKLILLDGNEDHIDDTYLTYEGKTDGVDVRVVMNRTRKVPLEVSYIGKPAEEYVVKEVRCKPEFVEITGKEEILAGVSKIEIPSELVNINGAREDLQVVVDLKEYLPYGVSLKAEAETSVLVIVELEKLEQKPDEGGDSEQ